MSSLEKLPNPYDSPPRRDSIEGRRSRQTNREQNDNSNQIENESAILWESPVAFSTNGKNDEKRETNTTGNAAGANAKRTLSLSVTAKLSIESNNDMIDRILLNSESRQSHGSTQQVFEKAQVQGKGKGQYKRRGLSHEQGGGKLTTEELSQLSIFSTQALEAIHVHIDFNNGGSSPGSEHGSDQVSHPSNGNDWSVIDTDSLMSLCGLLEDHVKSAVSVDMIQEARNAFEKSLDADAGSQISWYDKNIRKFSPGMQRFITLRHGIQAATILLSIMVTPNIDRRLINEDAIESMILLMRNHLGRNVIPALSNTGHLTSSSSFAKASTSTSASTTPTPKKKKQKQNQQSKKAETKKKDKKTPSALLKAIQKIYEPIISTTGLLTNLIERLDLLIQSVAIEDQPLLTICSSALSSLTIDPPAHTIQSTCIGLVTSVFSKYPRHRIVILEDLFPLYLKIPTSKRSMRAYFVKIGGVGDNSAITSSLSAKCIMTPSKNSGGGNGQSYIQMMTALVLSMIQACVTMPQGIEKSQAGHEDDDNDEEYQEGNDDHDRNTKGKRPKFSSGLLECEKVCKIFTAKLVQRCSKKGGDGIGASEFRPVLSNLIEDLLLVRLLPDFPAAEMLLFEICRRLCDDLILNSAVGGSGGRKSLPTEATYLTTAMDAIGTICSDVISKISLAKGNALIFPNAVDDSKIDGNGDPSSDSKEVNRCFCGRTGLVDTFMLDCDRCHNWFHGSCVGIARDKLPDMWICDECTMQLMVLNQVRIFSLKYGVVTDQEADQLSKEDKVHMMRILLLNYLSNRERVKKSSFSSKCRQFYLAKFVRDVEGLRGKGRKDGGGLLTKNPDLVCAHFIDLWKCRNDISGHTAMPIERSSRNNQQYEYLSEEGNSRLMLTLNASKSELVTSFPQLLGVIVALMGDENIVSLRKLAVKALSQIVQVDCSIMSKETIREAVAKRFNDDAISVREAAISLVGFYVLQAPDKVNLFHVPLLLRLNDNGVSVRKRAIKIFRDLISEHPSYPERATVFTKLLSQAADRKEDDGVRDLIQETFLNLWFADYTSYGKKKKTSAALVTPLSGIQTRNNSTGASDTARQMVEVVAFSSSAKYLVNLVREIIDGNLDNDETKKTKQRKIDRLAAEQYCASIVACLIEELILFEEQRNKIPPSDAGTQLVSILTTLGCFAEASPSLLVNHYDSLLHYLKADNDVTLKCEALIVSQVSKILNYVSDSLKESDIQRLGLGDLAQDLVKITYKFGMNASGAAVETLAKLATHPRSDRGSPLKNALVKLAKTFYTHLYKVKKSTDDFSKVKERERSNAHRALSVLGCICRYHNEENESMQTADLNSFAAVPPSQLSWDNMPSASLVLFLAYLSKLDAGTKCKALRAMAGVFSAHPRVMLAFEQEGLLEEVMSDAAHPTLQLESLQCWRQILMSEELRVESGAAKRQMESKEKITTSKKVSGDQDGDASLIGACCIQHAPRLYEMTASSHPMIRFHALLLTETLLRQGLLNPMEMVPYLFALQGDVKQPQIRALAMKLLSEETERRPDMIRQLVAEGIRHCYQFQQKVYRSSDCVTALIITKTANEKDQIECIFGQIFKESIRSSRLHSIRVIKSLLSLYSENNKTRNKSKIEPPTTRLSSLSFISEVIAYLPYSHLGDLLFIVHRISGIVALEGNEIMSRLSSFLRPYGLSGEDVDPGEIDKIERALSNSDLDKATDLSVMFKSSFDIVTFANLCAEASAIVLLLRLSNFLREAYSGLTITRVNEYLPGEKERPTDRGISRINNIAPFNSKIMGANIAEVNSDHLNYLICQYTEFRQKMRADDNGRTFLSDNDDNDIRDLNSGSKRKRDSNEYR